MTDRTTRLRPVTVTRAALLALAVCVALPGAAPAQTASGGQRAAVAPAPDMAASAWQAGPRAKARLISAARAVGTLETLSIGLDVELEPGWKTYWRSPGDAGIPPGVNWSGSENIGATEFRWPAPARFDYFGIETFGYHDRVVFPIDIAVARPGEPVVLRARADLLVCDDICIPHSLNLSLDLGAGPAQPSSEANLLNRFRTLVPGDGMRAGLSVDSVDAGAAAPATILRVAARSVVPFDKPDLIIEGPGNFLFAAPSVERVDAGNGAYLTVAVRDAYDATKPVDLTAQSLTLTLVDGNRAMETRTTPLRDTALVPAATAGGQGAAAGAPSLLLVVALALIGGLILNLMPCVLPVLAIKLLAVVGHGGGEKAHVRRGFLASTAGIVVAFAALAALAVGLKQAGLAIGWGIQFQQPLFVAAMAAILVLFACNMVGWFEIRLPGRVADAAARVGGSAPVHETSLAGNFLQGAFATLLATPCSAPFLGTAVGFALGRGTLEIFVIFLALGVGMALPFLTVAAFPGLATRLPRPGPWMIWLKRVLALALLATALWLLSVLAAQQSPRVALAAGGLLAFAALLLALRGRLPSGMARGAPALVAAASVLAVLTPLALPALGVGGMRPAASAAADAGWQPFDRAAIPELVAAGRTVFVDVTADWCITCKVNKQRVLENSTVAGRLAGEGIVRMRADWTSPDPAIADYLVSYGRYGIPFNIVYGPSAPAGIALPELLTDAAVLDALAEADRRRAVAAR